MSLLRLGLSAAISGNLRRFLSTATYSHPPWVIIEDTTMVDRSLSDPGVCFRAVEPPGVSDITAPAHLISPRERPAPGIFQLLAGDVRAASGDGHLLLNYHDLQAGREVPWTSWEMTEDVETHRFVCNPLSGQMLRLPDIGGSKRILVHNHMGLLTQADGGRGHGHGPPDRFAVAELVFNGTGLQRFLSDEGEWETVVRMPCRSLPPRELLIFQETVALGGRLWWVDLTFGVISVDPFAHRPEVCCIELPSGSVLPARAPIDGDISTAQETVRFMRELAKYRRVGVSDGRLRYAELTPGGPLLLCSFALDDEASGWTLEHQVELSQVLADGGYQLQHNSPAPQIAVLDPLNASAVHLKVGNHVVVVDVRNGKVIGASPPLPESQADCFSCVSCVLPPWLGASRIPTTGKKDDMEATDDLVICL
ncbi:uncharacterized protein LOC124652945 [Lolium rigidum]|uniref:uncharacterized protein LOC124652945 n=1 Tax=Lolium rigidum TaxID=89674 RepID=UPI001F5C8CD0|nr:uncharacterized protein LOC124652945 [Lolium rigidum]